ncbi:hypothetical protein KKG58_02285 [Patescibacteria group bacterium]|nr:hypothetical protein [Patescibacteria group bacterium]
MQYQFPTLRFYLTGLIILILIFFFTWFPRAQIDLIVASEPLIMDFEIKLDSLTETILFNLDTIPARVIISRDKEVWSGYKFIEELEDDKTEQIIVFKEKDLEWLVIYKVQNLLNEAEQELINDNQFSEIELGKQVFEFHPEKWEIEILKKDFSKRQWTIKIFLEEEVVKKYDLDKLKQEIRFKKKSFASQNLENLLSIKKVEINLWPWFWQQMPVFSNHINFSIKLLDS